MAEQILQKPIVILDGGLGTTLDDEHGIEFFSTSTPLWSSHVLISDPEKLLQVQTDFVRAGADILLTATYQASFDGFRNTPGVGGYRYTTDGSEQYMRQAVSIARRAFRAAEKTGLVALSLGAYGATLIPSQEYGGKYPENMISSTGLRKFHLDRILCFTEDRTWDDIDLVAFETIPRISEVSAVRTVMQAIEQNYASKKFWISCVFPNEDESLPDGSSILEVVEALLSTRETQRNGAGRPLNGKRSKEDKDDVKSSPVPYAIGINCTKTYKLQNLVKEFEKAIDTLNLSLPHLVIYPDGAGGLVYDTSSQKWARLPDGPPRKSWDEEMYEIINEVQERGRWKGVLVGGCCKTTPGHIAKLRKRIEEGYM